MTKTTINVDQYIGASCTLNGKPATIVGRREQFATVWANDDSAKFVWSWTAVARIMASGGDFRS